MNWAQEYRVKWIGEMLHVYGFINREHIVRKFRVSVPQARADLAMFKRSNPSAIEYDPRSKLYRLPTPPSTGESDG